MKIKQILPQDHKFTEVLDTIALKPKLLYYRANEPETGTFGGFSGALSLVTPGSRKIDQDPDFVLNFDRTTHKAVAIVGARKCTKYGEEVAYKLAYDLAKKGIIVISGLAFGIDINAHRGALDAGGITIAILASGVDDITPRSNQALGKRILANKGVILSEYPPHTSAHPHAFLLRNRLVSALSDAVIIVEAGTKSGSLNTATHAIEQGRELFAVPGPITSPMSVGTNGLLKTGAHPCTSADDIIGVISPKQMQQMTFQTLGDTELENQIITCIRNNIKDGEKIIELLKISPSEFNSTITMLEIKSIVRPLGANLWALI